MDELEEIRKRKIRELQKQQEEELTQQQEIQSQVEQLESIVKNFLSKEALQRFGNIKAAHPEKAVQLLAILGQAIQQGQIKSKLTDEQLKNILKQLQPEKKEFKIKRR